MSHIRPNHLSLTDRQPADFYLQLAILLFALVVFLGGLGQRDIVTSHEARVAQTARIMNAAGSFWTNPKMIVARPVLVDKGGRKSLVDSDVTIAVNPWLVPVLNGQIRLNKPPLPYWMTAISFAIFRVNEFAARLPTAMLGALAVLLMFQLGRHLFSREVGLISAMLWVSTHFVVDEFRKSMADPYLAFFSLLAVVCFLRGGRFTLLCWIAMALGALAKGPVVFLTTIPAFVVLAKWSYQKRSQYWQHLIGVLLFLVIALPWVIAVVQQVPNAMELWKYDAIESQEKSRPFWMYAANLFQLTLPWTPFWIASLILAVIHKRRGVRTKRRHAIFIWMTVIVLLFSIKPVKKNAYLLPLMPALLVSIAETVVTMMRVLRRRPNVSLIWVLMSICTAVGIGFACAIAAFCIRSYPDRAIGISAAIVAIIAGVPPLIVLARSQHRRWIMAQTVSFGVILTLFLSLWQSTTQNARSPQAIADSVLSLSKRDNTPIALAPSPEEISFYLPLRLADWKQSDRVLLVLDKPDNAELADQAFIQARFDYAIVQSWKPVLRDTRYVVVEVVLNRDRI